MRKNLPVTNEEKRLDPKKPIVTRTNLKGIITYANPAFVEISGFTEQELLGQPHNIVRHPDMPEAAFDDLWKTLKQDRPWKGLVKNRSKDGAFYWVNAHVAPQTENGVKVGYVSVRSTPTQSEIDAAERLYANVRSGSMQLPETTPPHQMAVATRMMVLVAGLLALLLLSALQPASGLMKWAIVGAALLFGTGGLFWIRQGMLTPLRHLESCLQKLSEGNFRFEVDTRAPKEYGIVLEGLDTMRSSLRAIVADVLTSATRVQQGTAAVQQQAGALSHRLEEQSGGIVSVAAALEQLSVSVSEISEATQRSSNHAEHTQTVVQSSSEQMRGSIRSTTGVATVVEDARGRIEHLKDAVLTIGDISKTIREIADQTNLLALNAAIEAARAGEQGRGFSVVADEVRKLAERTSESTVRISETIEQVRQGALEALSTMERASEEVGQATTRMSSSTDDLARIEDASKGVAESAREIANMLAQQSQASDEVANSMERMSTLTESNQASVSEVEQSMQDLNQIAKALHELVRRFEHSL